MQPALALNQYPSIAGALPRNPLRNPSISLVLFIGLAAGFGLAALKAASMSDEDFWE